MRGATQKVQRQKERSEEEEEVPHIPQLPSPSDEQNKVVEEYLEQPAKPPYAGGCSEDNREENYLKTKVPQLQPAVEQELADFYERNPIFYDKSRSDFKISKKKERLLQEQAAALNLTDECSRLTKNF